MTHIRRTSLSSQPSRCGAPGRSDAQHGEDERTDGRARHRERWKTTDGHHQAGNRCTGAGGEAHRDLAYPFGVHAHGWRNGCDEHGAAADHACIPADPEQDEHGRERRAVMGACDRSTEAGAYEKDRTDTGYDATTRPVGEPAGKGRRREHPEHVHADDEPDAAQAVPVRFQVHGCDGHRGDHHEVGGGEYDECQPDAAAVDCIPNPRARR